MKRYLTILAAATMLSCGGRQAGYPVAGEDHTVKIASFEEFQSYFRYVPGRDIIISAHRGGMQEGYPENCIASCEKTLSMMPDLLRGRLQLHPRQRHGTDARP